jgi:hypothetical protein
MVIWWEWIVDTRVLPYWGELVFITPKERVGRVANSGKPLGSRSLFIVVLGGTG